MITFPIQNEQKATKFMGVVVLCIKEICVITILNDPELLKLMQGSITPQVLPSCKIFFARTKIFF